MAFIASTREKSPIRWTTQNGSAHTATIAENPYNADSSYARFHSCAILPPLEAKHRKTRTRKAPIQYGVTYANAQNNLYARVVRIDKTAGTVGFTLYGELNNPVHYSTVSEFRDAFCQRVTI